MVTQLGDLLIALKADVDDFHKASATASDITASIKGAFVDLGRAVRNTGAIITAMGAASAAAMGVLAARGEQVKNAYREVGTLFGDISAGMDRFGQQTRSLTQNLAVQGGTLQTLDGLYQVISAGITDTSKATSVLRDSIKLSTAGFAELQPVVDTVTTAVNAYGLSAQEAGEVTDTLLATVKEGKITLDELSASIGPVLALAAPLGAGIKEIAAGMATLTARGIPARRAATALRSTITQLRKPSEDLKAVFRSLAMDGLVNLKQKQREAFNALQNQRSAVTDLKTEYQDLQGTLVNLQAEYDKFGDKMRDNRIEIQKIRLEARKQNRKLTESEKQRIEELQISNDELRISQMEKRQEIEKTKEAQEAKSKSLEDAKSKQEELKKEVDRISSGLSDSIIQQHGFIDGLELITKRADEMNKPLAQVFRNVRSMQFVLPAANNEFEDLNKRFETIQESSGTVDEIFSDLSETASFQFRRSINELKSAITGLGTTMSRVLTPVVEGIAGKLDSFNNTLRSIPDQLKENIAKFGVLATTIALIAGPVLMLTGQLIALAGALGPLGVAGAAVGAAVVLGNVGNKFDEVSSKGSDAESALKRAKGIIEDVAGAAKWLYDVLKDELLPGFKEFASGVADATTSLVDGFNEVVGKSDGLKSSLKGLISSMGDVFEKTGEWLSKNKGLFKSLGQLAGRVTKEMVPPLISLAQAIGEVVGEIVGFVTKIAETEQAKAAFDLVIGAIGSLAEIIGGLIGTFAKFISENDKIIALVIKVVGAFTGLVVAIGALGSAAVTAIAALQGFVSTIIMLGAIVSGTGFMGALSAALVTLKGIIIGIVPYLGSFLSVMGTLKTLAILVGGALSTIGGIIVSVGSTIVGILGGPLTLAILAIIGLIAAWKTNFLGLRDKVKWVVDQIAKHWDNLKKGAAKMGKRLDNILDDVKKAVGGIPDKIGDIVKGFKKLPKKAKKFLKNWGPDIAGIILSPFSGLQNDFRNQAKKAINAFSNKARSRIKQIRSSIAKSVKKNIEQPFENLIKNAENLGKRLIKDFVSGMEKEIKGLKKAGAKGAKMLEKVIGVSSNTEEGPLSNLETWGPELVRTFAKGIEKNKGMVDSAVKGMVKKPKMAADANMSGVGNKAPSSVSKSIEISERAVYFEAGAFEGVSDQEIPQIVQREINSSLQDIVDDIEGRGRF